MRLIPQIYFRNSLSIVILSLLLEGCKTRKIEYSLKDISACSDQRLKNIIFDIEVFDDHRRDHEKNLVLFKHFMKQTEDEQGLYYNHEKKYRKNVPEAMTVMLADHIRKRSTFKSVRINRKDSCDYYMMGSLHYFYGNQVPPKASALFNIFCVFIPPLVIPGLIIALTEKTKGSVIIEMRDLAVYNKKNELIYSSELSRQYNRKFRAWRNWKAVYRSTNNVLREYFSELIIMIERDVKSAEGI